MKNPRELWRPKFKMLPEACASCPFRDHNDKEFGEKVRSLAEAAGVENPATVHEARGRIKSEVEMNGDFICHGTAYDPKMGVRPSSEFRQCPGAAAHYVAAGEHMMKKLGRKR